MVAVAQKKLSEQDKKQIVKEILGNKYHNTGNNWPIFSKVIDYVGNTSDVFTLAELIPVTNTLISGSSTLSIIGSTAGALSIFLMPVGHFIAVMNAWEAGHRTYSYRCVAYTITAWAFDQAIPRGSNTILRNIRSGILVRTPGVVDEYNKVWRETSKKVKTIIDKIILEKSIQKKQFQFILKALGNGRPQDLNLMLLRGFEDKVDSYQHKIVWKSNYKIIYPN